MQQPQHAASKSRSLVWRSLATLLVLLFCVGVLFLLHDAFVLHDNITGGVGGHGAGSRDSAVTALSPSAAPDDVAAGATTEEAASIPKPRRQHHEKRERALLHDIDPSYVRPVLSLAARKVHFSRNGRRNRSYARMSGVDVLSENIAFVARATLRQCLMMCDAAPNCNYIVRNISLFVDRRPAAVGRVGENATKAAAVNPALVPTECWLKKPMVFNPVQSRSRETWIVARAPQPVIAVGVLAAPAFLETRLVPAYRTWLKHEDTIVMMEDTADARARVRGVFGERAAKGLPVSNQVSLRSDGATKASDSGNSGSSSTGNVLFLFQAPELGNGTQPGAWKNLALLKYMPTEFLRLSSAPAEWYFLVDDDTFVIMPTLRFMLSVASPDEPIYTGLLMAARDYTNGAPFIQGGAGIVLSRNSLLEHVYDKLDCCIALCKQSFGDFRTGCCVTQAAKTMGSLHRGFYSYSAWDHAAPTEMRKRYGMPIFPVTFHRFREARMIYAFQEHVSAFIRRTTTLSSRYMLFPIDPRQHALRHDALRHAPPDRRYAFVDDLAPRRVMNKLPALPLAILAELTRLEQQQNAGGAQNQPPRGVDAVAIAAAAAADAHLRRTGKRINESEAMDLIEARILNGSFDRVAPDVAAGANSTTARN